MPISAKAMELEQEHRDARVPPTLGAAYEMIRDQWIAGERDRDVALHLSFLAWYRGSSWQVTIS